MSENDNAWKSMSRGDVVISIVTAVIFFAIVVILPFLLHPLAGLIGVVFFVVCYYYALKEHSAKHKMSSYARGSTLLSPQQAVSLNAGNLRPGSRGVLWGNLTIPSSDAKWHFCVVGAVGSGKTLTLRMLMQDQFPSIRPGSDTRALVYDAKQDMVQILESMRLSCPVVILNPFDKRAAAWHMAADVDSPAAARQLAVNLVPEEKESQPFFSNACRELLTAVVTVFTQTRPGKWTLRDVLLVMKSRERLKELLGPNLMFQDTVANFIDCGETTFGNIMGTIITKLGPYESIAAAWERASRKISIKKWLTSDSILILGNDERIRSSLDAVNRLFVAITAQHVLSMSESETRTNWFFFDEFSEAGKLDGLESIVLRGRSKGCAVVLGFQDIQAVQEVYGEKLGNALVGQCGNKAFLRIESPQTAEWASSCIHKTERFETNVSRTRGATNTTTESYQKVERSVVMPGEFMKMPVTSRQNGLHGVYIVRSVGCFTAQYSPSELSRRLGHIDTNIIALDPIPSEWQFMSHWSRADEERLGFEESVRVAHSQPQRSENAIPKREPEGLDGIERIELR